MLCVIEFMANRKLSFIISSSYVAFATIYAFYAMDNMVSEGFLYFFFFPANFFTQLIIFTETDPSLWLLGSQLVSLAITYFLLWGFLYSIRTDKKTSSTP